MAGPRLGLTAIASGGHIVSEAMADDLYKRLTEKSEWTLNFGATPPSSTVFGPISKTYTTGTTTASPLKLSVTSVGTGTWFTPELPRISMADMVKVVDAVVKERYPHYDPRR